MNRKVLIPNVNDNNKQIIEHGEKAFVFYKNIMEKAKSMKDDYCKFTYKGHEVIADKVNNCVKVFSQDGKSYEKIEYYIEKDGGHIKASFKDAKDRRFHCENGPAYLHYYPDGKITIEFYIGGEHIGWADKNGKTLPDFEKRFFEALDNYSKRPKEVGFGSIADAIRGHARGRGPTRE